MCGIFGMVSLGGEPLRFPELLAPMAESLRHRGPDNHGSVLEPTFALGCQRLRIVDLNPRADQPFHHAGNGCWLVCNGEIYNSEELRRRYGDYPFTSRCDVEAILPLYLDRGADGLSELDGMFGLAIWDEDAQALTLARDRAGEKPLFYCRLGEELWFASELQTLLLHPRVSRDLDHEAISQYLDLGYVVEPRTPFLGIRKIEAGTIVRFTAAEAKSARYWAPGDVPTLSEPVEPTVSRLRSMLRAAVSKQMVADVPVGVFISGGLDSALLASLAADESGGRPIHTFVARFGHSSYDESSWAADCAKRLRAEHREVLVDEESLADALGAVTANLAEPLADPALLPTYLLAREARKDVGVVLSGEGADELFGGYPTYLGHQLMAVQRRIPDSALRLVRALLARVPESRRKVTLGFLLRRFLSDSDRPRLERHLRWFGVGAADLLAGPRYESEGTVPAAILAQLPGGPGDTMALDYCTYLRDCLLVKIDRATMLNSLEARAPYLDRDLSYFAFSLPYHLKVRRLTTKWLLKRAAEAWLPAPTIRRRKRGLSVPVADWIDSGLRHEVDRLLAPERLARQELLDSQGVQALLAEHRSGKINHGKRLWALVMLQYWLESWAPERAS